MTKVSKIEVGPYIDDYTVVGKVSYNDGLTFNFTKYFDEIFLERSMKYQRQARPFRSQNHERALSKLFDAA